VRGTLVADVIRMESRRSTSAALCTIGTLLGGCLDSQNLSMDEPILSARDAFVSQAWPALTGCAGCHGSQPAIDFLAPGTAEGAYETLFAFQPPVVDVEVPSASRLLTMGTHTGPELGREAAVEVLAWLQAERDERLGSGGTTDPNLRVGPYMPQHGVATKFDLPNGGSLTVVTEASEGGLYFKRITLASGSGLALRHPLFVQRPAQPIVDEIDRFSDVDLALGAGETVELGPAWFLSFNTNEYLSIHFKTLEAP
jgi:hypothetical protein